MSAAELDDEVAWRWWCEQSASQGLEPEIRDPATISRVVTLALAGDEGGGGRAPSP